MLSEKLLFWTAASELDTSRSARSVMHISESTSVVLLDGVLKSVTSLAKMTGWFLDGGLIAAVTW
jgi:hypothetical protein